MENLLFSVKVLVAQLPLTLCDSVDCSTPGSSVHGINSTGKNPGVCLPFPSSGALQGLNPGLLHCRQILCHLSYQGSLLFSVATFINDLS